MSDNDKTKAQLLDELARLRKRVDELGQADVERLKQARELAALHNLAQLVNAQLSLDCFGEAAISGLLDAVAADFVVLFRREGGHLQLQAGGPKETPFPYDDVPIRRVGECLCGLAVSSGSAFYSADMASDPRCTGGECMRADLQSFAALPLRSGGEVIGVLGLGSATKRDFQEQASFLETIANDIAMCFYNALLYEQLQRHAIELERRVEDRTTELRAANERLQREIEERRQAQATLDAFFSEATAVLNIVDEDFVYIKTDSLTPTYFGLDSQSIVGRSLKDELAPQFVEQFGPMMRKVMETGKPVRNVEVHGLLPTRPDETTCWRASYFPLSLPGGRRGFGVVAVEIGDMKRVQEALVRERRNLLHMLEASDHERQMIAYDIHDGLAQHLAAAIMQFQVYEQLRERDPGKAKAAHDAGVEMVQRAHGESRRLISGVRPPVLDAEGVASAIAHLVHEQRKGTKLEIEYYADVDLDRLHPTLENALYRIAQEALENACRHSQSRKVTVSLSQEGDQVRLEVQDWGVGFDPDSAAENRFGLKGISDRARLLGGHFSIDSTPGKGTCVRVSLPVVGQD